MARERKREATPADRGDAEEAAARRLRSVLIGPLRRMLKQIHRVGTERDRAGNRRFFYDHYLSLLLLYFVNPSLTSLRALQNASNWEKVRKRLGIPRVSLGSLSESASVFDAALVRPIMKELVAFALPHFQGREAEALANLTAVDGSVFAALPRMAWALWMDEKHRGAKLHLQYPRQRRHHGERAGRTSRLRSLLTRTLRRYDCSNPTTHISCRTRLRPWGRGDSQRGFAASLE